ncbi:hypothetical protein PF007_g22537 [Phytophthora fragariae]|nr:hypothetical protein PF003_g40979 [Phytophthora fragariae]KAE9081754.1 hypothetical protein PF007_g22537 [Phytophthora fragariae]
MAFGRRSGRLSLPAATVPSARIPARGPIGKQAAYAAVGQQPPRADETPPLAPSSPPLATVPAAGEEPGAERIALRGQITPRVPAATVVNSAEEGSAAEPPSAILDATEQDDATDAIPDDPELGPRKRMADVEEAKSETDEPNGAEDLIDLDVFDGDNLIEGLRKERLFSPTAGDDVNIVATADTSDSESDADDEDIMTDNDVAPALEEGVEDVEDVEMNDDDVPVTGNFDLTDDDLRDIAESGWIAYDEDHSRNFQVDAATDFYSGESDPTRSAGAYADTPLGMIFYFLPKEL